METELYSVYKSIVFVTNDYKDIILGGNKMSQSILYYPTIDIQDSEWLRNAMLYWDEICSIVPFEEYPDFSPELRYLQERNLYRAIYPQELFHSIHANEFLNTIARRMPYIDRPNFYKKNIRNYRTTQIHKEKIFSPSLSELIHYNKIPDNLSKILAKSGHVRLLGNGWMEMDERFANLYMRTLAEYAAKYDKNDMVIGTDKLSKINDIYRGTGARPNREVISLALNRCLPIPTLDVGFEEILDFKDKRRDELLELRKKIRDLERDLSQCDSIELLKARIADFREDWEIQLINSEKMFRGDRVGFALGCLRTFIIDAGGAAGLAQLPQTMGMEKKSLINIGTFVGAVGLIGVRQCFMDYRNKISTDRQNGGFAYLVSAYENGIIRKTDFNEII